MLLPCFQLERLGLQALSKIAKHPSLEDPKAGHRQLQTWYRLAANFPAYVTTLVNVSVPAIVASSVKRLHHRVFERATVVTLNGDLVESNGRHPSFLNILKSIGPQMVAVELLLRQGISMQAALKLIQPVQTTESTALHTKDGINRRPLNVASLPTRLDWRLDETDIKYKYDEASIPMIPIWDVLTHPSTKTWPEHLDKMAVLMMMRGMIRVKAPLYHILIIFDPLDLQQLSAALEYLNLRIPMKLYFLPIATEC